MFEKPVIKMERAIKTLRTKRHVILSNNSDCRSKFLGASILATQIVALIVDRLYTVMITCLASTWFGLIWDLGYFSLGLYSMILSRQIPISEMDGNESELTFGQIVPLLLLGSTVLVMKEEYDSECSIFVVHKRKACLTWSIDHISGMVVSTSDQGTAILLHDTVRKAGSITDIDQALESSGGLIIDSPVEDGGDLQLQPPRRVDTEAGGRAASTALTLQQCRQEPGRRSTYPPPSPTSD